MNHKTAFLILILVFVITACNIPLNDQMPETLSPVEEKSQPISIELQPEQEVPDATPQPAQSINNDTRGYILFTPLRSTSTYLIDYDGDVVHSWPSEYYPGNAVYLLENGNLLRMGNLRNSTFDAGGAGGIVQEINWDGNVVWEFEYTSDQFLLHHDIEPLPNGNILMIAWDYISADEAIYAGRNPSLLQDGALWVDKIIEVDPSTN
jgi:hypothetical protein